MLKLAPCLATGNVMIVKQSEKTPLGALALAPLLEDAGIPEGVVQVLPVTGTRVRFSPLICVYAGLASRAASQRAGWSKLPQPKAI
jgi:hypothetical protein